MMRKLALRLVLRGTFKAWAEIDSFYQAKKGRVQPEVRGMRASFDAR